MARLHVMRAFRTPYDNKAIGDVTYSMHQRGRRADIYIASLAPDSKTLYGAIEQMLSHTGLAHLQGGMGSYPATIVHPPLVHVDVPGPAVRWKDFSQ